MNTKELSRKPREIIRLNSHPMSPIATGVPPRIRELANIKAVMFDIYGTLFISGSGDVGTSMAHSKASAIEELARKCELEFHCSAAKILEDYYGEIEAAHCRSRGAGTEFPEVDIVRIWKTVFAKHLSLPKDLDDAAIHGWATGFECLVNPVWPMPGATRLLSRLAKSHELGLISNAQFYTVELFPGLMGKTTHQLGFNPELEIYSFQIGAAKPGPEIFARAIQRLGELRIPPENTLFIGNDMLNDIAGAKRVGFRTALFAGDQRSLRMRTDHPGVQGMEADLVVDSLEQIAECLANDPTDKNIPMN